MGNRLALEDLQRNFPSGANVPAPLVRLLQYQNSTASFHRVDDLDFELYDCGEASLYWFDHNQSVASQFAVFGHSTDGSMYGYWLHSGASIDDAPIVYLTSDGDGRLLANSLDEFLILLSTGEEDYSNPQGVSAGPSQALLEYREWLRGQLGDMTPPSAESIIARAEAAHPNLNEWIDQRLAAR